MESGVEDRHLRHAGQHPPSLPHSRDVRRIMKRRKRNQLGHGLHHRVGDERRLGKPEAPVDHPMADRFQPGQVHSGHRLVQRLAVIGDAFGQGPPATVCVPSNRRHFSEEEPQFRTSVLTTITLVRYRVDGCDVRGGTFGDELRIRSGAGRLPRTARSDARQTSARADAPGGSGPRLDGNIAVEMAADGRLSGFALDPSVRQLDERVLAREIMAAVNDAWAKRVGIDESAAASWSYRPRTAPAAPDRGARSGSWRACADSPTARRRCSTSSSRGCRDER